VRINVVNAGYGPMGGLSSPVSLLGIPFVRDRIINFMTRRGSLMGYSLGYRQPGHHPFHCWVLVSGRMDDTLLARKPKI